ncbi:MAG TPA: hypothetical protein VFJ05_07070 [Nitrososphaeraceae archaeon]|nr:hypothetical protein [Nitrososphaeraceae archaeon]
MTSDIIEVYQAAHCKYCKRQIYLATLDFSGGGGQGWIRTIPYDWNAASQRHRCISTAANNSHQNSAID